MQTEPQWDTIKHSLEWMKWKRLIPSSVGEDVKELSNTASGNIKWSNQFGKQ